MRALAFSPVLVTLVVACGSAPGPTGAPPPARPVPGALLGVDLSPEAVADLDRAALWRIGVEHAGWPPELPAELSKDDVHHRLLDAKYDGAGDFFGYGD